MSVCTGVVGCVVGDVEAANNNVRELIEMKRVRDKWRIICRTPRRRRRANVSDNGDDAEVQTT